jgi:ABC-type dipeptide/oligopeptide/nickel transport system ATPase component
MVFQDPMQALNPSVRLGEQLAEVLTCHRDISHEEAWQKSIDMLKRVNMPDVENVMTRYSHQISGGQQQRVVIAMAMLNNPALIIMDEPTTALDVTVEAAVLDLLEELKNDFNAANIFITHNLGVVARVSDYLCVMYAGQMVESGPLTEIFRDPRHPYTMGLLACVPRLGDSKLESLLHPIRGRVPPPAERSKKLKIAPEPVDGKKRPKTLPRMTPLKKICSALNISKSTIPKNPTRWSACLAWGKRNMSKRWMMSAFEWQKDERWVLSGSRAAENPLWSKDSSVSSR